MKKIKYVVLTFCLMFMSILNINALDMQQTSELEEIKKFNIVGGDSLNESKNVDGSSIIAGNNITAQNVVNGIDMVFGNVITYNSISDYSFVAGNTINVKGITNNDGFIFGNVILFDGNYKASRDLFIFGNNVSLKGEISRNVTIYASNVDLDEAKISGNVKINSANIDIKNIVVEGTLLYNSDAKISISNDAVINDKNTYDVNTIQVSTTDIILNNVVSYASILVVFVALALLLPSMFKKIETKTDNISFSKFIAMIGYGLLFIILIPILFIILLMLTIGAPLALLILTMYIIVICMSTIFTGYFVGLLVWKKFIKKEINVLLVGLIGISIIKVLSLIPYIGTIVVLLTTLLSFSIVAKLFSKDV